MVCLRASPELAAVPKIKAGDVLGTRKGPIYADRRRPLATDAANINADFIGATTYRHPSLPSAQDFRQTTENRSVGGSIPPLGTTQLLSVCFESK
jgi:hypothetical protein